MNKSSKSVRPGSWSLIWAVWIVLLLLALPALVGAQSRNLFYEGFETYPADSFPGGGWTLVYNGAGDQFQRVESGTAASGTNAFRLFGQPGWAAEAEHPVQFPLEFAVEAMVFTEPETAGCLGAANPALGPWGVVYGGILFSQGQISGWLRQYTDLSQCSSLLTNLGTYATGRWYHAKSVYHFLSRTFDVYIDGQLLAGGLPILDAGFPTAVRAVGEGSIMLVDDIKVTSAVEDDSVELALKGTWKDPDLNAVCFVRAEGARALVATDAGTTDLLQVTNSANPTLLGTWESIVPPSALGFINGLALIGGYATDLLSTVELVDFSDLTQPVLRDFVDTPGYVRDLACAGQFVLVADGPDGLLVLDAADPANLRVTNRYSTRSENTVVEVDGKRAYLGMEGGLLVLDISAPMGPLLIGAYPTSNPIRDLKALNGTVFLIEEGGQLLILDCRQPASSVLLGACWAPEARAVRVQAGFAFLASGPLGLQVVDVSDPAKPQWVAGYQTEGFAQDLAISGNHVLVAAGTQGLLAFEFLNRRLRLERSSGAHRTCQLSWQADAKWVLQRATSLSASDWETIPGSQSTNAMTLPVESGSVFFRLVRP